MKVLMISGDPNILQEGSEAYSRFQLQKSAVEVLDVCVWPQVHSLKDIRDMARSGGYDVITAQDPFWRGHLAWHLATSNKAKLNIQVHTDLRAQPLWRRLWAHLQLRHADSVRVVSESIKKQVVPFTHGKISVLPIFTDLVPFQNLTRQPHPHFHKTILWFGRFESEKNPMAALSILKEVRASGVDAGLIMLGSGSLDAKLRREAAGFSEYVEFPGWQDPRHYLAMADVVISTSRHESYGASTLQSLAAGVSVVSPDYGIAREAGAHIVPIDRVAEEVISLLRNPVRGELKLTLPTKAEWVEKWRETLE